MRPPFGPCFLCPVFPPFLLSIIFITSSVNLAHAARDQQAAQLRDAQGSLNRVARDGYGGAKQTEAVRGSLTGGAATVRRERAGRNAF